MNTKQMNLNSQPMKIKESTSRKIFHVINFIVLTAVSLTCILPFLHVLAVSLSNNSDALAGRVTFWPIGFTTYAYEYLIGKGEFFKSVGVSAMRLLLGIPINMLLIILSAYPMSKENREFKARKFYIIYFFITMFFSGGLIPTYMVIRNLKILDTIWALVLPTAFNAWNMILLMNFFRNIPKELEEAAFLDGAGYVMTLYKIYLPISKPSLATIFLFTLIYHWNSWFDGILYMNTPANYPLASYLSTLIMSSSNKASANMTVEQLQQLMQVSDTTIRSAQIFLSMLPILIIYPFLQRYFVKGIVVGSVKG